MGQSSEITGKVLAINKEAGTVLVEFEPHASAGPALADQVKFTTMTGGFPAAGGAGEVVEVGHDFAWVRPTEGSPGLGYDAIIAATGTPVAAPEPTLPRTGGAGASDSTGSTAQPDSPSAPSGPPLPPPDADGLQPRVLGDGVAELLIPYGLPMRAVEEPEYDWEFMSPSLDEFTDEWLIRVYDYGSGIGTIEEEHTGLAAGYFASMNDVQMRYDNRRVEGGMECVSSSRQVAWFHIWSALCRQDGIDYRLMLVADPAKVRNAESVATRIVASLRVGGDVAEYAVTPPPVDALRRQTLGGELSMLLPEGVRMWTDPTPSYDWEFQSGDARAIGLRWEVWIIGNESSGEDLRTAAEEDWALTDKVLGGVITERFRGRDMSGSARCLAFGYDMTPTARLWEVTCQEGDAIIELKFDLDFPDSPAEGDDAVLRMVQSLRLSR